MKMGLTDASNKDKMDKTIYQSDYFTGYGVKDWDAILSGPFQWDLGVRSKADDPKGRKQTILKRMKADDPGRKQTIYGSKQTIRGESRRSLVQSRRSFEPKQTIYGSKQTIQVKADDLEG